MIESRRRVLVTGLLAGLLLLVFQYAPALRLGFEGDDFELFSAARIGGFSPAAIFVPHRGVFLKPVVNAFWAGLVPLFGANPAPWHLFALLVHLLNALLLGHLAARLPSALARPRARSAGGATGPGENPPSRTSDPASADEDSSGPTGGGILDVARRPGGPPSGRDLLAGGLAALVWSVHDRLAEPVLSLASLNHSLTFAFYLLALVALLRALRTGAARDRLLASLAMLLALFSYEVGASVILAAGLLILMDRGDAPRARLRAFGPPILLCAAAWAALQAAVRLGPGMTSYYSASASLALENLSAIGLAFLHIRSGWVAPGIAAGLVIAGAFVALLVLARDRVIRFGLAWSLLAWLPVAPIPFFSDRYHYIAFAGLCVAAGRALGLLALRADARDPVGARGSVEARSGEAASGEAPSGRSSELAAQAAAGESGAQGSDGLPHAASAAGSAGSGSPRSPGRPRAPFHGASGAEPGSAAPKGAAGPSVRAAALLAGGIVLVHVLWSLAGAREQTAFWAVKGQVARMLLADASGAIAAADESRTGGGTGEDGIVALVWWGEPDFNARLIARFENQRDGLSHSAVTERIRLWPLGELPFPGAVIPWVGETSHPIYVRGEGIMGVVTPADLFNVAGAARGVYFRLPRPRDAAQALAGSRARIAPLGLPILGRSWQPGIEGDLSARLNASLLANHEIPVLLSEVPQGLPSPLHIAWLESVDRSAAWAAEYGPPAGPGSR